MEPLGTTSIEAHLRSAFTELIAKLGGLPPVAQKWTNALIERYTESQRHYHTIAHIYSMLICLQQRHEQIKDPLAIQLAIYFHDWIYDPKANDNEVQSIACFRAFSDEVGLENVTTERVVRYIECTISHKLPLGCDDSDLRFFLDFDLEVLSRGQEHYSRYAAQIRLEYAHFSEGDYSDGRVKVLDSFLNRDRLYFSGVFYERNEAKARKNLAMEIESLTKR